MPNKSLKETCKFLGRVGSRMVGAIAVANMAGDVLSDGSVNLSRQAVGVGYLAMALLGLHVYRKEGNEQAISDSDVIPFEMPAYVLDAQDPYTQEAKDYLKAFVAEQRQLNRHED